jgi:protein-L-isoaspartate(D-aspartate) O-methyltransferase
MDNILSQTNMIKQQLRTGNIVDPHILNLYQQIPREDFVPFVYKNFAYSDMQIPIGHQQTMLTPLEEAAILQAIQFKGDETVLEIGSGTGFFTTLLSHCARRVISIDYIEEFTQVATQNAGMHERKNIEFLTGDGHNGWAELAPYDVIILSGAVPALTEILKLQLGLGGKIFAMLGKQPTISGYLFSVDEHNQATQDLIFETDTPLLIGCNQEPSFVF